MRLYFVMTHPIARMVLFLVLLMVLFALELMGPVQDAVIMPFTGLLADISAWIVMLFDSTAEAEGIILRSLANGVAVAIMPGCNGVEAMIVLTAAMLAFPSPLKHKLIGLLIGFIAIQALNLVRIISLFYLLQWNFTWFQWFHLYLWQALIILDAMIVFIIWLRMLPPPEPEPAHA